MYYYKFSKFSGDIQTILCSTMRKTLQEIIDDNFFPRPQPS